MNMESLATYDLLKMREEISATLARRDDLSPHLSARTFNTLRANGIYTISDLRELCDRYGFRFKFDRLGIKGRTEIRLFIEKQRQAKCA